MSSVQAKHRKSSPMNSYVDCSEIGVVSSDAVDIETTKKSAEDVLAVAQEPIGLSQGLSFTSGSILQSSPVPSRRSRSPSPNVNNSPLLGNVLQEPTKSSVDDLQHAEDHSIRSSSLVSNRETNKGTFIPDNLEALNQCIETPASATSIGQSTNKLSITTNASSNNTNVAGSPVPTASSSSERPKGSGKVSERAKKKAWYSVLYPSYKSRSEDFKKLFKGVPDDERLVVDYSCAVQRDILVHGRLYVSQNYLCFYANIFRWETCLSIRWKDVTAITKEKTALVIPNAILVSTTNEKYFITSFTSRDKAYLMLFRVWQNALMDKPMQPQEMWQWVHNCYGDELGLTSDDEDYIDPYETLGDELGNNNINNSTAKSADSVSEDQSEPQSEIRSKTNVGQNKQDTSHTPKGSSSRPSSSSKSKSSSSHHSPKLDQFSAASTVTIKLPHRKLPIKPTARKQRIDIGENGTQIPSTVSSEQLPTDMSDSSDSDSASNIPFVSTAECNSMHEGRQLVHTILPINVDTLFSLLFSKSKFLVDFHNIRKTTNMVHEDWIVGADGLKCRKVTLTVALTQAVGPKCAHVTESQVMRDCSDPSQLYSIDITSTNAGIPYADSFYVFMHYCLVRTVDDHTMFSVHAQVKYKKSVWGVVKGFIEKNTWAGLEDFYTALLRALQSEYCIPPAKAKGRRRNRGGTGSRTPLLLDAVGLSGTDLVNSAKVPFPLCSLSTSATISKQPQFGNTISGICGSGSTSAQNQRSPSRLRVVTKLGIFVLMMVLVLLNVILYFKLWSLEDEATTNETTDGYHEKYVDYLLLKNSPKTQDDWIQLMKRQETLHATETIRWQHILNSAVQLLRKTEQTLSDLLALIKVKDIPQPLYSSSVEQNVAGADSIREL